MTAMMQSEVDEAIKHTDCFDYIKYAAYRSAAKLRYLQKYCGLDFIDLQMIKRVFEKHRLAQYNYITHSADELVTIINEIYSKVEITSGSLKTELPGEMVANFIISCYSKSDTMYVNEHEMKVFLVCLCAGKLGEKYKYLYRLFCDFNNEMSSERMKQLIKAMVAVPQLIGETSWSKNRISKSAIDECFSQKPDTNLTEDKILNWLKLEHEAVVWLPTLHRLAHAETVKHDIKCNVCKVFPVVGFRYRCLKCFNYDQCQECFYLSRVTKHHKTTHPVQEYCQTMSSKDDAKALMKTFKNKFSRNLKSKRPPKPSYQNGGVSDDDDDDDYISDESEDAEDFESLIVPVTVTDSQFLYSSQTGSDFGGVVPKREPPPYHTNLAGSLSASQDIEQKRAMTLLEEENRFLVEELHKLKSQIGHQVGRSTDGGRGEGSDEDDSYDSSYDDVDLTTSRRMLAIKNHNVYLEQQITQLKSASHQNNVTQGGEECLPHYSYPPHIGPTHPHSATATLQSPHHVSQQPFYQHNQAGYVRAMPTTDSPDANDDMMMASRRIGLAMRSFVNNAVGGSNTGR